MLSDEKRNDVLALWEIQRYGLDSFDDPDYLCLYGLKPKDWYTRGVRILARTAVECTRDRLADLIGGDIADLARTAPSVSGSVVIDPFAGSGNTLYWIKRRVEAGRAVGFELDEAVFEASRRNLSILNLEIELVRQDRATALRAMRIPQDQLVIVFVAPPWGDALSEEFGLDLSRTKPPITQIIDFVADTYRSHKLLFATQVHERVDPVSVADVTARLDRSELRTYDVDTSGRNHGVLLGTRGWG
jgi:16S rRNA G966 N2-methylase RsmD